MPAPLRSLLLSCALVVLASACTAPSAPPVAAATPVITTPAIAVTGAADAATDGLFPYAESDISQLQAWMVAGDLDSVRLTRAYLERIAALDRAGPRLRAVLELNPDAIRDAEARDRERRQGHLRGPLHGIPVLIKDNIGARPMATTAGSLALEGFRPPDAFIVQRLREAGAVILGKTNLSEWANYRDPDGIAGWSARGGQTRNPYRLNRSPCGSSSGSAVAVSANLAAAAVGTETDGSIVCPSAVNGIVGLKPTVGLLSRGGIIPVSYSQDTPGPMARSVADVAILLTAMAGRDDEDPATAAMPGRAVYDYAARLARPQSLRGARLGLLQTPLDRDPAVAAVLARAVQELRDAGATVVPVQAPAETDWRSAEALILRYEFKAGLERYLGTRGAPRLRLADVMAFNRDNAERELPLFDQRLFEAADATGPLSSPEYITARTQARRAAGQDGIDALLQANRLDALIAPTTGTAWPIDPADGNGFPGGSYSIAAVAGYPSLSVPMGRVNGLPLGLLFMGPAWSEPRLLELGHAYEQRTQARRPPLFETERLLPGGMD